MADHSGLNGFLQALREVVSLPHVELAVHLFADLALATSFLGVALGLFDYLADLFQRRRSVGGRIQTRRCNLLAATRLRAVLPTRICDGAGLRAWRSPCLRCCFLPFWHGKSRQQHPDSGYRVWGGKPLLAMVFTCGIVVIRVQFSIAAGLLPEIG